MVNFLRKIYLRVIQDLAFHIANRINENDRLERWMKDHSSLIKRERAIARLNGYALPTVKQLYTKHNYNEDFNS